ncbi:diguanylate cyclase [Treponema sp.]|uniref:sensor domain-containing diguanylate cyclase n=1 Tax=Treponema sp. TaxID=166 RepID=UPI0025D1E3D8|nr:diguanylate cyclase [Treponema sp.]MCR5217731.1 diguanylate cyclase [Treponema sp.]
MRQIKIQLPVIASIIITLGCLIGISFWFDNNTEKLIEKSVKKSLEQTCRSQASVFKTRLEDQMSMLKSMSLLFDSVDMNDKEQRRTAVQSFRASETFSAIYIADKNGDCISASDMEINIADQDFFKNSMNNQFIISKAILPGNGYNESLIVSVPVRKKREITGVLFGVFSDIKLNLFIEGFNFNEDSSSILVSSDGMIIARTDKSKLITSKIVNFFDLGTSWGLDGEMTVENIKAEFKSQQPVIIPYQSGTQKRMAILAPVAIEGWYYALITPQTIITDMSTTISSQLIAVETSISLAFLLLIFSTVFLLRSNNEIQRTNEKFRIATKQTQTIVFDYDFYKDKLELSGDTEFLCKNGNDKLQGKEIEELLNQVHTDDISFIRDLDNLRSNDASSFNREVRIRCTDNNYYWFKFIGTVVRSENGNAHRFVGNLVNVDEVMNKEQLLKQKAEEDPLTGILNKATFRERIENVLSESNDNGIYAFYIIDLDNFKKVNDTMGHIIGDKVLLDTAKKLCMVFSDKDFVGRVGGDEFAAFLKLQAVDITTGEKILQAKAKSICSRLNEIYTDGNVKINVSSSIGVAIYPQHGTKYADLFRHADEALYVSKNNGKNQFHIYSRQEMQ